MWPAYIKKNKMKIKKISLKNIRSYENQEIEFPEGSTLLSGDIGAGKTSILLGIEFALFGLQPGQRGSSLLRSSEKDGGVILEFEIDGNNIIIERMLKKGKTIAQDYSAITINGEKKEVSVTELKNIVLGILSYPSEFSKKQNILYKFTVYTPQEEMKQIILQDPETRINTLRHVFGIDKYKRILENASILASKLREEKREKEAIISNLEKDKFELILKEENLDSKKINLISIEKELFIKTDARKRIMEEKNEISFKIEEKVKFEQEIEKTKIMILTKKDILSGNERSIEGINREIKELKEIVFDENEISSTEKNILGKKSEKEKINSQILEISSKINSLILRNEDIQKMEKKISNLELCPTCFQNVDAVYRANVLNKSHNDLAKNKKDILVYEEEKKFLLLRMSEVNNGISVAEKRVNELKLTNLKIQGVNEKKLRLEDAKKSQEFLQKDILLLAGHLEILRESVFNLKKFEMQFEIKKKEFDESLKEERFAEIKVAELKKEIEVFSRQIDEIKEKVKNAEKIKEHLIYVSELENWVSKKFSALISFIEKNVMTKLKAEFSRLFGEWFSMLVSDSFVVAISDDFSPLIEYADYELDYSYLSGGERTAVALAYRLSLNQVINSVLSKIKTKDMIILDEPTDGFSDQQLDKMRNVLEQLKVKQLIIVSHEQKIEGFVENVIKFRKENGTSFIDSSGFSDSY